MATEENTKVSLDWSTPRPCKRCNGTGKIDDYHKPGTKRECYCGVGMFPGVDVPAILATVCTSKGKVKKFRSAWPSKLYVFRGGRDVATRRAYFVWRLARFHGGADVTMPMTAFDAIRDDPFKDDLDLLAAHVAVKVFGTHKAGTVRWGRALGVLPEAEDDLPWSAHEGGPVVTSGLKPTFEKEELV